MEQAVQNTLHGRSKGEVHADMSESAGNRRATRVNLGGTAHQCDQNQTYRRPNHLNALAGSDEADSPTDENWRDDIVKPAGLKIAIREPIYWAADTDERRVGSR